MAEDLKLTQGATKEAQYNELLPQIEMLVTGEKDYIANLANICAALKEAFGWLWVGFYEVKDGELVLGPFQGPVACTRITFGKGVCGSAWKEGKSIIVPDVDAFPGHIACSSKSRSEIVLPVYVNSNIKFILDVDSEHLNTFDDVDLHYLLKVCDMVELFY